MTEAPGLSARIAAWDAALSAVRAFFRGAGLLEVSTPVRLPAVAIEPYIEPIAAAPGVLATSPELPMKRLVMAGSGPIFQVAHVLRASERGARHAEEFHLVEWYRPGVADPAVLRADVEAVVAAVFGAIGRHAPPATWQTYGLLDLIGRTTGLTLRGDEDASALYGALAGRPALQPILLAETRASRPDVVDLAAWSSFFSHWSDTALDPWLASQPGGVHVVEFPPALAALSCVTEPVVTQTAAPRVAQRVESHVAGIELSNGYLELRDATEQRRRFDTVQALRASLGQSPLPMPDTFIGELQTRGLPETVGCALGLDRLVALAMGSSTLSDVALPLSWSLH